jgi:hypothetical protein
MECGYQSFPRLGETESAPREEALGYHLTALIKRWIK